VSKQKRHEELEEKLRKDLAARKPPVEKPKLSKKLKKDFKEKEEEYY
jgi:hypothetical protein